MPDVILDPNTRAPSSPIIGFIRTALIVPAVGFVVLKLRDKGVAIPEEMSGYAIALLVGIVSGGVNALGKFLRDRGLGGWIATFI